MPRQTGWEFNCLLTMKSNERGKKVKPGKQGQTRALIICWECWGYCYAWMPALHTTLTHIHTLQSVHTCKHVESIIETQQNYCTCETVLPFFLRKSTPAQPAPISRRIPFPGDSGGGEEHNKCTTLLISLFMPSLKRAQRFLSRPKWWKPQC